MSNAKASAGKCYVGLLAPELLAMTFREVMALHERNPIALLPTSIERVPTENELDTRPLHALSHVCRYWREVALGTPALWSRIHGRRPDEMEVFLRRSQPVSVTLFLSLDHWGDSELEWPAPPQIKSVIATHGARLARLDLAMIPSREHVVPLFTSLKAPHLQTLTITSPYMLMADDEDTMSREPLLNGEVSSLSALALMPVLNWMPSSTPFPNLTHLSISFHRLVAFYHPFHLLELLSNARALAFLHTDYLGTEVSYSGDWQPPSDPIHLPNLRSVLFTNCLYNLLHTIISHLSYPQDLFIRIRDVSDFGADSPISLPPLALSPVTSLDISIREKSEKALMVADGPQAGLWVEGTHAPGYWHDPQPPGNWVPWLLLLPQSITFTHVTHLHIHIASGQTFWPEFLDNLPGVTHLSVLLSKEEPNPSQDFDAAEWPTPMQILCNIFAINLRTTPPSPMRCRALHELKIEWQEGSVFDDYAAFHTLPFTTSFRRDIGHRIHHLVLQPPVAVPLPDHRPGPSGAHDSESDIEPMTDIFSCVGSSFPWMSGTRCEIARPRRERAKGVCAFVMRDVWRVEGENRYWDVDDDDKPQYMLPPWMS